MYLTSARHATTATATPPPFPPSIENEGGRGQTIGTPSPSFLPSCLHST